MHQNERIPADLVLLYATEKSGAIFIRTDQLDGETDWKLRKAVSFSQNAHKNGDGDIVTMEGHYIVANAPSD